MQHYAENDIALKKDDFPVTDCPLSWTKNNEKCYKFVMYPMLRYDEAVKACQVSETFHKSLITLYRGYH
ncbi:hypothetical protein KUTeg_015234 [Tegillarca granosa]|uniref:Uncharacterized protein n=1 Tax=Tegillarca granosa TaxID=220873 RepID=A0ABQ9EU35_TEGGR|nr:hypothetical protein KUTeg_015234 [Tegillarca granosa]